MYDTWTCNVRKDFAHSAVCSRYAKSHTHSTLVSHVRRPTAGPLCLDVFNLPSDRVISPVNEQRNADVDDLRYERIPLLVWGMSFNLGQYESVPVLNNPVGQSRYCNFTESVHRSSRTTGPCSHPRCKGSSSWNPTATISGALGSRARKLDTCSVGASQSTKSCGSPRSACRFVLYEAICTRRRSSDIIIHSPGYKIRGNCGRRRRRCRVRLW